MKRLLKKAMVESKGAPQGEEGPENMCHLNSRKLYFKLKEQGQDVKYVEGQAFAPLEYGEKTWIDHAWLLINGQVYEPSWGPNDDVEYKGHIIKDEYMTKIPEWMSYTDNYKGINIRVSDEFPDSVEG